MKENMKKSTCHYSGGKSWQFWGRINAIKDVVKRKAIYAMGCDLQNLEGKVLSELDEIERKQR